MSTSKFRFSSILFITSTLAAMAIHWYLTRQHIGIKYSAEAGSAMCNISETVNCSGTIMSGYSEIFGIPLAIFGFITNLFILIYGLKSLYLDQDGKKSAAVTLALALFSVASSVVMGLISVLVIKSLCPFCVIAYVLSVVTLLSALKWTHGFRWSVLAKYGSPIGVAFLALILTSVAAGKVVMGTSVNREVMENMALVVSDWKLKSPVDVALVEPLTMGPDSAKMKILEFSDFLCPHCKSAFPNLHDFAKRHKNDVQLIFQNFPLDGCGLNGGTPGRRCDLAKIAFCSQKQNKGWEAQEYLFSNQENLYELADPNVEVPKVAQELGVDAETLKTCYNDPATLTTLKSQLELGKRIGVEGTPAIFINNRPFRGGPSMLVLEEIYKSL